ncbi:hypothetical protein WMW72_34355 [Paenibacillus filicis]|uniref:Uncharacterized protein n=1 Tax=Paenibacillus filicis TaxID=669464 RepID=A0ABU9DWA1_9BACL
MGLDYSFVTVIHDHYRDKLFEYIKKHGTLSYGDCACIHFEMDSFILKYLEGGYDWTPHYDKTRVEEYIEPDGKARIGCIYISVRELEGTNKEIEVSFTAATTDMSLLFKDSVSISRWFITLSKELNSIITYIDLESEGIRIIYCKGLELRLELNGGEYHLSELSKSFLDIIKEFSVRYRHFEE